MNKIKHKYVEIYVEIKHVFRLQVVKSVVLSMNFKLKYVSGWIYLDLEHLKFKKNTINQLNDDEEENILVFIYPNLDTITIAKP